MNFLRKKFFYKQIMLAMLSLFAISASNNLLAKSIQWTKATKSGSLIKPAAKNSKNIVGQTICDTPCDGELDVSFCIFKACNGQATGSIQNITIQNGTGTGPLTICLTNNSTMPPLTVIYHNIPNGGMIPAGLPAANYTMAVYSNDGHCNSGSFDIPNLTPPPLTLFPATVGCNGLTTISGTTTPGTTVTVLLNNVTYSGVANAAGVFALPDFGVILAPGTYIASAETVISTTDRTCGTLYCPNIQSQQFVVNPQLSLSFTVNDACNGLNGQMANITFSPVPAAQRTFHTYIYEL